MKVNYNLNLNLLSGKKDKDKNKEDKKHKHKKKDKDKAKERKAAEEVVASQSVAAPIKLTIAKDKLVPETPSHGIKIKIPKERLKVEEPIPPPQAAPPSGMGQLKIKIGKELISERRLPETADAKKQRAAAGSQVPRNRGFKQNGHQDTRKVRGGYGGRGRGRGAHPLASQFQHPPHQFYPYHPPPHMYMYPPPAADPMFHHHPGYYQYPPHMYQPPPLVPNLAMPDFQLPPPPPLPSDPPPQAPPPPPPPE